MVMQRQRSWAIGLGIMAVITFVGSFFISTEGIYLAVSDTREKFENMDGKYDDAVAMVKAEYDERIASIEAAIQAIKAPSWNHGDLTTPQQQLMAEQRAKKDQLYTERTAALEKLKKEHQADKQSVVDTAEKKASDYYMYVSVILVMELMTNVLLSLWYYKIYEQENPEQALEDKCKGAIADQEDKIRSICDAQYGGYANDYYNRMAGVMIQQQSADNMRMRRLAIAARASNPTIDYEDYMRYKAAQAAQDTQANTTTSPEATTPEKMAATEKPQRRAGFIVESLPDEERKEEPEEESEKSLNAPKWHTQDGDFLKEISGKEVVEVPYPMTEIPEKTDTDSEEPVSEKPIAAEAAQEPITPPTFKGGPKKTVVYSVNENGKNVPNGYCYCCHKPLVNKRKDAIWCSPVCKAKGNNFTAVKPGYLK